MGEEKGKKRGRKGEERGWGKKRGVKNCSVLSFFKLYLLLGCQYGNPSRKVGGICLFYLLIFFRVGKSLACHFPGKWCLCA